jgi:ribose-phosphate pyrophosphokinase
MPRARQTFIMAARDRDQLDATGSVVVLAGSSHRALASGVARELGRALGGCTVERFPDGEIHVEVEVTAVDGRDVFVVQPTSKVASDHLLELLLLADACRRTGAASVSAVIPYFGYARQDRRKHDGEALGVRVVAQLLETARFERIFTVDPRSDVVEASLEVPAERLTAVPLLARALEAEVGRDAVVVAPDLGAVRLAREYARLLRLPLAVVHKVRQSGTEVSIEYIAGEVRGLRPILVDDMIATGGTIVAAMAALRDGGSQPDVTVAATHAVLAPQAIGRLREAGLRRLFVSDTIACPETNALITTVSVAPLLAGAIARAARRALAIEG